MSVSRGTWLVRGALAVLVVGVLAVLVASVVVEPLSVEPPTARWWRGLWTAGVAVAFLLVLRARARVMPVLDGEAGGRPATGRSVVAIVLATLPFLTNAPLIGIGLAAGLPPTGAILATVGSAIAVVTVLVLAVAPVRHAGWWPHRPGLAAVPAAAAVVALAGAAAFAVPAADATLVHVTPADQPMTAGTVPDSLGRVAWVRELGVREELRRVSPIAGGFALETDDGAGVIGIDGSTGEDRWAYTRSGAVLYSLFPADDGRLLVVLFDHGRPASADFSWTVLDAATGRALHGPTRGNPFEYFGRDTAQVGSIVLTSTGSDRTTPRRVLDLRAGTELWTCDPAECKDFVGAGDDAFIFAAPAETGGRQFRAFEAATGEELWSYQHPSSCDFQSLARADDLQPASPTEIVVGYCDGGAEIVGLDAGTGEPRWASKRARSRNAYAFSNSGAVNLSNEQSQDDEAISVVDAESGEHVAVLPWRRLAEALAGDFLLVSDRDGRKIVEIRNLATGDTTEPDVPLEVTAEHCVSLDDGLHCSATYDRELVVSLFEDGSITVRDWSEHGLQPGRHAWAPMWGPESHAVRLLPVDGAVVLGAISEGIYDRHVLVGLVP